MMNPVLLLLVFLALIAFATGLLDFHVDTGHIDWMWLGVGFIAVMILLMLTKPRFARRVLEKIGL